MPTVVSLVFDFELTEDEMTKIQALDKGVCFFNMGLSELEAHLSQFVPEGFACIFYE